VDAALCNYAPQFKYIDQHAVHAIDLQAVVYTTAKASYSPILVLTIDITTDLTLTT
jgi:hypothetical protein